ncbi:hypothetical protein B5S32_g455 [[Candida] boidinii]|nr:hypothetical protein B5S32_g455 [[Candida] boidinii]
MYSQGDQLLNQLRQYDERKYKLRSQNSDLHLSVKNSSSQLNQTQSLKTDSLQQIEQEQEQDQNQHNSQPLSIPQNWISNSVPTSSVTSETTNDGAILNNEDKLNNNSVLPNSSALSSSFNIRYPVSSSSSSSNYISNINISGNIYGGSNSTSANNNMDSNDNKSNNKNNDNTATRRRSSFSLRKNSLNKVTEDTIKLSKNEKIITPTNINGEIYYKRKFGEYTPEITTKNLNPTTEYEILEDEPLNSQLDKLDHNTEEADDPSTVYTNESGVYEDENEIDNGLDQDIDYPDNDQNINGVHVKHTYTSLKILNGKPRFVPPINFSVIESGIYRSGHPQPNNFEFLDTLNLKTIIYLGDKVDNYDYYKWISEHNGKYAQSQKDNKKNDEDIDTNDDTEVIEEPLISFRFFNMKPFGSSKHAFNDEVALNTVLNLVLNKDNYPILIHSNKGKHRVGVLVGLIRKVLQGWSLSGTFDEYGKFAREKGEGDLEFIEMFKPVLKIDPFKKPDFVRIDSEYY